MRISLIIKAVLVLVFCGPLMAADTDSTAGGKALRQEQRLQELVAEFFEWRRIQQSVTGDHIPRMERPAGWLPDWSPAALADYRLRQREFLDAVESLDTTGWSVSLQVDARLLKAAVQRAYWELEVLQAPRRDPLFYLQQTLGSVFELLTLAKPIDAARAQQIVARLNHIPLTLKAAQKNLDRPVRPFAQAAIERLDGIEARLEEMQAGLLPHIPDERQQDLDRSVRKAVAALESYRDWLESRLEGMQTAFAIGPRAYQWFLVEVALLPYTPDELLARGDEAWQRAVAWGAVEKNRNRDLPPATPLPSVQRQIQVAALHENELRAFLESQNLMTVPDGLQHYLMRPLPEYLAPLSFMGVASDLGSETRLDENAYRYLRKAASDPPCSPPFAACDPRPLIIHEGVPGHYFQLARSWANPNPLRRRYIDSSANEGIAFYMEELLLQAGLFDYSPRAREIIFGEMRLQALRLAVDIRLAVGELSIEQAADHLARGGPMDRDRALQEAVFIASNPGRAISQQAGKLQILRFLAAAGLDRGEGFSLRHFHDFLMENGNLPIALQRWEYLGRNDEIMRLDALGGKPVTVPR